MTQAVSALSWSLSLAYKPHLHIPHMAEKLAGGERLVSRPRIVRRERS